MLVLGEGCDDGILVDSQGATYARYASFAPGARELLLIAQQTAELKFANQIAQIEGADFERVDAWIDYAQSLAQADFTGPAVHLDYLELLQDFGDAFAEIDRRYEEVAAEIFNHKPVFLPAELLPAADWICNGGCVEEAVVKAQNGAFEPIKTIADRQQEAQQQGLDAGMIF